MRIKFINHYIIRFYDLVFSLLALLFFSPLLIILYLICYLETGNPLFVQKRLGKEEKPFLMFKYRTMYMGSPSLATHLVNKNYITKSGKIIRILKMDELPQLINVLKGEMSLVGPRPSLLSQNELINERRIYDVFKVKPGITGLAQINKIDMSDPQKLAKIDALMISNFNQFNYFKLIFLTFIGKGITVKIINKIN